MSARMSVSRAPRLLAAAFVAAAIVIGTTGPALAVPAPSFTLVGPSGTVNAPPVLSLAALSGPVASATILVDGVARSWGDVAEPVMLTDLEDGYHEVAVQVLFSSDWTADRQIDFTLDTTAPAFQVAVVTDLAAVRVGGTVELAVLSAADDFDAYTFALDGTPVSGPSGPTGQLTVPVGAVGSHTVSVVASDVLGNASVAQTVTWTTQAVLVEPVISWVARPDATTTSTSARFEVAVDAGAPVVVTYVLDLPVGAQSASPELAVGPVIELTGLAVGRHTLRVVVDRGGVWSALDHEWEVVAAPVAPAPAPVVPAAPVLSSDAIPASVVNRGIRRGATGEAVAIIQRAVGATPSGTFDNATRNAVRAFQRAHGLVADGIAGPLTWAAIVDVANGGTGIPRVTSSSIPAVRIAQGIQRGASGASVGLVQRIVGASPDGRFGPRTTAAVRAWQASHGLVADGIVGPLTWRAMTSGR